MKGADEMFIICLTSAYIKTENGKNELETLIFEIGESKNTGSLSRLYELASSAVYSFALSILKNTHDAEDVLQDLFVVVYNSASSYKKGNPMAWMLTITKNLCLMKLRERTKTAQISPQDWENLFVDEIGISQEERIVIESCLEKLSDQERQIVILHAVCDLKHKETAKLLNIPLATVLSKYQRALKKMRRMIGE